MPVPHSRPPSELSSSIQTEVCVIGAGATGLCAAALLANAGIQCVVVERTAVGAGATTNNAGVLHSGARYAVADPLTASQCLRASRRLTQFARYSITNESPAYYLIVDHTTEDYAARFLVSCAELGIPTDSVDGATVCLNEAILDKKQIRGAIAVPDYVFDPFLLLAAYEAFLHEAGVPIYLKAHLSNIRYEQASWRMHLTSNHDAVGGVVESPIVLVTAGAWSPCLLEQFGISLIAHYFKGSMFVIEPSLSSRILCLCNLPVSGDTFVPCGALTLLGSTWEAQDGPEPTLPSHQELQRVIQPFRYVVCSDLGPHITHGYSGVRVVLAGQQKRCPEGWERVPQGMFIYDHQPEHGVPGVFSAFGGRLTTHLEAAIATTDLILERLGRSATSSHPLAWLPPARDKPDRTLGNQGTSLHHWRIDG